MNLPPLPKTYFMLYTPSDGYCDDHLTSWDGWDDEQMRAYAEAAVLAMQERCAKLVEDLEYWPDRPIARLIRAADGLR